MSKRDESPEFKTFWEEVWRPKARHTDGRGLARDAFTKHVRNGADPQDIIDGARYFFRSMKDRDREFVPLSATWLNRESYTDLAALEREYQARKADRETSANVVSLNVVLPENHFLRRHRA